MYNKGNNIFIGGEILKSKIRIIVFDFVYYVLGSLIFSIGVTMFLSPNEISPGGFTGVATLINHTTNIPSGIMLLILNIPVLIIGLLKFGGIFIVKTTAATLLSSLILTFSDFILPVFSMDKILASIFGGTLIGTGLSLILRRGATTGGVDIIAKLINRKYRHLTVGRIILVIDGFVILFAAFVYGNAQSALYSVVSMYASSKVLDMLLYGADKGRLIYIVTKYPTQICREINSVVGRGVTVIDAKGGYTGNELSLLLCTVRIHEVAVVYRIIDDIDNNAFIVVTEAGEIIGEGFKSIKQ